MFAFRGGAYADAYHMARLRPLADGLDGERLKAEAMEAARALQ